MRVVVHDREMAVLFRDGRYAGPLAAGAHRFLNPFTHVEVRRLPRLQWVQHGPVEAVSADRFPLRMTVGAYCAVTDAKLALDADHLQMTRLSLAAAAAAQAATVALDDLMVGREALARSIEAAVAAAVPGCGLDRVQVISLTLPPEVRRLFTDVERAKREAQASLERARGEQAALRALANAARLLKGNPELMNLRVLQAVGAGAKGATLVLGEGALATAAGHAGSDATGDDA